MFRLFRFKAKENLQRKESRDHIDYSLHARATLSCRTWTSPRERYWIVGANFAVYQLISGGPDELKPGPKIRRWLIC